MKTPIGKLQRLAVMASIAAGGIGAGGALTPVNALTFNFIPVSGTSQQAIDGFAAAGQLWSNLLTDNVTVNVKIGFSSLGSGILGEAQSNQVVWSYSQLRSVLDGDKTSTDDTAAVNSLTTNSTFNRLINSTTTNGGAAFVDAVSATTNKVSFTTANAKALGLTVPGSFYTGNFTDGTNNFDSLITFSSDFTWDFDRSNGITGGSFDFVGVAVHEIGHSLGFYSDVDNLDYNANSYAPSAFTVSLLDLFRYSTDSKNQNAIDFTTGTTDKYFSLDNGTTKISSFSTGVNLGDGRQASHWKDSLGLGIMDPTSSQGELLAISNNDLRALDVIGWNRASTAVPEPSTWLSTFICAAFGTKLIIKRRQRLAEVELDTDKDKV